MSRVHDNPFRVGPLELRWWDGGPLGEQSHWLSLKCRRRPRSFVFKRTVHRHMVALTIWINR